MLGKGLAQTSSPTFADYWLALLVPGLDGGAEMAALQPAKGRGKLSIARHERRGDIGPTADVAPPDVGTPQARELVRAPQLDVGGQGEPVLPSARIAARSSRSANETPAFWQLLKKAAPAPNQVTLWRAAKSQSALQSGRALEPLGEPSNRQMVAPASMPPTCWFHITHPVALYQWKRSPNVLGT